MHKPLKKSYTSSIYSKTLDKDIDYWIDGDFILPDLLDSECLAEEDVIEEIRKFYRNKEDN